jgi:hypothetical protein
LSPEGVKALSSKKTHIYCSQFGSNC